MKEIVLGDKFELDAKITSALKEEGVIRELARTIQEMRKDGGLKPDDAIKIYFKTGAADLKNTIEKFEKNLGDAVGAKTIEQVGGAKDGFLIDRHFKVDNQDIWIGILKN